MQVILVNDLDSLGRAGDIVKVAPGYARNYLLPKRIALAADPKNMKWVEQQKGKIIEQAAALRTDAEGMAARIGAVSLVIAKQAGEEDKLYGAVTSSEIADKLSERGIKVDKRKIVLADPIKRLGEYSVPVKIHADLDVSIKINVVRKGEEKNSDG